MWYVNSTFDFGFKTITTGSIPCACKRSAWKALGNEGWAGLISLLSGRTGPFKITGDRIGEINTLSCSLSGEEAAGNAATGQRPTGAHTEGQAGAGGVCEAGQRGNHHQGDDT